MLAHTADYSSSLVIQDCNGKSVEFVRYPSNSNENAVLYESKSIKLQDLKVPLLYLFELASEDHTKYSRSRQCQLDSLVIKVRAVDSSTVKLIVTNSIQSGGRKDIMVIKHYEVVNMIDRYDGDNYCLDCLLVYISASSSSQEKKLRVLPAESKLSLPLRYTIGLSKFCWTLLKMTIRISTIYCAVTGISWFFYDDYTYLPKLIQTYASPLVLHALHKSFMGDDGEMGIGDGMDT